MVTPLVPSYNPGDGHNYGGTADRTPGLSASLETVLSRINYPTGGYTAFTYELNQAKYGSSGVPYDVGGVRIQQMIDYSFASKQAVVKNYQYTLPDGTSSGVSSFPSYTTNTTYHHYGEIVGGGCGAGDHRCEDYTVTYLNISASSVYGLGTLQGSHIGYSYVTEYQSDATTGVPLGKTVYKYRTSISTSHDDDITNGDLLEKSVYDDSGKLLDDLVNTYDYSGGEG